MRQVKSNPRTSVPQLRPMLEITTGKKFCNQTKVRTLHRHGYHGRIPRKRPLVSRKNRLLRLKFAKEHLNKGQEFWKNVLWSHKTKINLWGSDGVERVWRKANEGNVVANTILTIKHGGGSIIVWGVYQHSVLEIYTSLMA